jgi:hypothetical protein
MFYYIQYNYFLISMDIFKKKLSGRIKIRLVFRLKKKKKGWEGVLKNIRLDPWSSKNQLLPQVCPISDKPRSHYLYFVRKQVSLQLGLGIPPQSPNMSGLSSEQRFFFFYIVILKKKKKFLRYKKPRQSPNMSGLNSEHRFFLFFILLF